jgi:hypothetical protein
VLAMAPTTTFLFCVLWIALAGLGVGEKKTRIKQKPL